MSTRRKLLIGLLAAFLAYTGAYVFIYLARAFSGDPEAAPYPLVHISHTDDFVRSVLVGIFFLMGEVFLLYLAIVSRRGGRDISVRQDLWEWLEAREELTGEPAEATAHRAIAQYRARLEGGDANLPST